MAEILVEETFALSAGEVWKMLSDFAGIHTWMPGVEACEVEGEGIGALRRVVLGGMQITEKLISQDDQAHTFSYSITEGPLPVQNHLSTVSIHDMGAKACQVKWAARFSAADPAVEGGIGTALTGAYGGALKALKQKLGA